MVAGVNRNKRRRCSAWLLLVCLAGGAWLLGGAGLIQAKAHLAQGLIAAAWQRSSEHSMPQRPWPWADTWPVARLLVPRLEVDLYALNGFSGSALAFGPGMEEMTQTGSGLVVIAGHRDTHFHFLRDIEQGDKIRLQRPGGDETVYRVKTVQVVDSRSQGLPDEALHGDALVLTTCYPFDAVTPGGPLRFVVVAFTN